MSSLGQDLRYALRSILRNPGFASVAVLTLALGIGATTAIFSVVHAVLLRQLPYSSPEHLVMVWEKNPYRGRAQNVVSPANYLDWQTQNTVLADLAAMVDARLNLTGSGEPEELAGQRVSANYFKLLGTQAALGRTFAGEEGRPNAPRVVVLSFRLWERRFGGDRSILGRPLALSGDSYNVIGVLPRDFQPLGPKAEFWIPASLDPSLNYRERAGRFMTVVARLKPDVTLTQARSEMDTIAARLELEYPAFNKGWGVTLVPLAEQLSESLRPALRVLMGAVGFLLLIGCANVANLQLVRSAGREREIALRTSLGAGRTRLIRQLLVENLVLAALGGALGVVLAAWGIEAILAAGPKDVPLLDRVRLDPFVLLFSVAVSAVSGILFGLAPALAATRPSLTGSLKEGGRGASGGRRGQRLRDSFAVVQVALALVLVIGAGLAMRSFLRLLAVDPGFQPQKLLTMKVSLPGSKYREPHQRVEFFRRGVERMQGLAGVQSASAITFLPLTGLASATSFLIQGRPAPPPGQNLVTNVRIVQPGYFRTMGIPLRRGRDFTLADTADAPRTFVISESLARRYWIGEDPIGQRLIVNMGDDTPGEIVGITGDVRHYGLDREATEMVYYSHPHLPLPFMSFVLRTGGAPENLARDAVAVIRSMDAAQPVSDVQTMEALLAESVSPARFRLLLLGVFSGAALLLAAVGIYGVVSYSVTQRTHELGVRMALGARRGDILRLVLGRSTLLALAGVGAGLAGALALTRIMRRLLFQVTPTDPATFLLVALAMAAVAIAASLVPARRASRVEPVVALRYE